MAAASFAELDCGACVARGGAFVTRAGLCLLGAFNRTVCDVARVVCAVESCEAEHHEGHERPEHEGHHHGHGHGHHAPWGVFVVVFVALLTVLLIVTARRTRRIEKFLQPLPHAPMFFMAPAPGPASQGEYHYPMREREDQQAALRSRSAQGQDEEEQPLIRTSSYPGLAQQPSIGSQNFPNLQMQPVVQTFHGYAPAHGHQI